MHSFIIAAKNKDKALSHISFLLKEKGIDPIDIDIQGFEKSVGIENVRQIQKKLLLKPLSGKTKAVVIDLYNGITIDAQNAMLKVLEEPPNNTIIYLIIQNKELLLPTILSRCKIIELKDESKLADEEISQYTNILISLPQLQTGERLKLAQDVTKNKVEVGSWLEKMILVARKNLIDHIGHSDPKIFEGEESHRILVSLNKTYIVIKTTNANQRLVLENLFLSL